MRASRALDCGPSTLHPAKLFEPLKNRISVVRRKRWQVPFPGSDCLGSPRPDPGKTANASTTTVNPTVGLLARGRESTLGLSSIRPVLGKVFDYHDHGKAAAMISKLTDSRRDGFDRASSVA